MLRSRAARDSGRLHSIFKNLKRLKAERQRSSLTEITPPGGGDGGEWSSNPNDVRMFERTVAEAPVLLRPEMPILAPPPPPPPTAKPSSVFDAATGMDAIVSSITDLTAEETYLLRKLTVAITWAPRSSPKAAAEAVARLRQLAPHPRLLRLLTPYAWKLLWAVETETVPSGRTKMIGDLMEAANIPLSQEQEIAYIGALFWGGAGERAMERWQRLVGKESNSPEVWNLGVRMLALQKKPEEAERVLREMEAALGRAEHKTWIPVVLAYNHVYESEQGWTAYEEMRKCAKKNDAVITARQFDDLAMSFLDSYQPKMGLEVYKHMVFAGHNALDRQQTETYRNLWAAVQAAQKQTVDPEALNELSLDAIKNLPARVVDKYFYAGWMLNLMRMDRTDLAWYLVRDVMQEQNFPPDSAHCNWILQGFLQEGNMEMAEHIFKEMVQARLRELTWKKKTGRIIEEEGPEVPGATTTTTPTADDDDVKGGQLSKTISSRKKEEPPIAPATVQTFSIFVHYHARRKHMEYIVKICTKMLECDIPANSYIMNHLLFSLFRTSDMPRLANTFETMVNSAHVRPDFESFTIMWTAMWRHHTQTHRKTPFLTPRQLFRTTINNIPRRRSDTEGQMKDIWYAIIKCFLLARDLEGTLLALHAGHRLWGMEIDGVVVCEVAFGVLRARPWDPRVADGTRPRIDSGTVEASVDVLYQLGRDIMLQRGRKRGPVARKRTMRRGAEEGSLESLTLLLWKEMGSSTTLVMDDLKRARADMGLQSMDLAEIVGAS